MRLARLALPAPAVALVLTPSCLNDRPVNSLGGNAAVALRVVAPKVTPATGR